MDNNTRHVLMYFNSPPPGIPSDVEAYPLVDGQDFTDQIELPLLNNLITPLTLVFFGGGETGKRLADLYDGKHTENPTELPNLFS